MQVPNHPRITIDPQSPERRREIVSALQAHFAQVDAQRQPASPQEADEIITEALRSTRPNYRPVR